MTFSWHFSALHSSPTSEDLQMFEPHSLLFVLPNSSFPSSSTAHLCASRLLHLSLWFNCSLDVLLAVLALCLNCLLTASIIATRSLRASIRRSLSVISTNYAFLAAILLAKKCFWLFSALSASSACAPLTSSVGCKLQEFPVVAVYLHSLASPLAFAVQMYTNGPKGATAFCIRRKSAPNSSNHHETTDKEKRWKSISSSRRTGRDIGSCTDNGLLLVSPPPSHRRRCSTTQPQNFPLFWLCSTQQMALIVLCLVLAFLFTAFDQEPQRRKVLVNCSLPLAVRQKELLFALLTLMLCSQLVQMLLWQFVSASAFSSQHRMQFHRRHSPRRASLRLYWALSLRDLFLVEALLWSLSVFLTGLVLFQQFVLTNPCGRCTRILVELAFTTLPLLVSFFHPILSVLVVAPISYSAQQLFPILKKALPEQEPATPPLPRPIPTVRILITEH